MLSFGRFTTRFFLVILIIFIYIILDFFMFFCRIYYTSYFFGRDISSDVLMHMFVNHLPWTLVFVVSISPPLLSLFLLRRPSFWRVLLHVATAFYILWIVYTFFTYTTPLELLWKYVTLAFLLVYSGAALVAGLPEATAAGWWARLVYYAALLLWLFLVVALLS
jgi:hypothetical protein